jgi:methyl-accepting chemotaxis protein
MAREMNRISDVISDTAVHIRELEGFSGEITHVLNVIRSIAEQTNLLALNAAIEAARGRAGAGLPWSPTKSGCWRSVPPARLARSI